jgi:hypothetical protein
MKPLSNYIALLRRTLFLLFTILCSQAFADVSIADFSGPSQVFPGRQYEFSFRLTGAPILQESFTPPPIIVVFYMTPRNIASVNDDERLGSTNILAVGLRNNWLAPSGILKARITIPTNLAARAWPLSVRNSDAVPPGTNFVYAWTTDMSYKTTPVYVPPISIQSVTPNPARRGSTITIQGVYPNAPKKLFINRTEVNSALWSFEPVASRIRATVPSNPPENEGRIEVMTALETNTSTFFFRLRLPDLRFPDDGNDSVQISRFTNQPALSIYAGIRSYLSFTINNDGDDQASLSTISVTNARSSLLFAGLYTVTSMLEASQIRVTDLPIDGLEVGTNNLVITLDRFKSVRESSEDNNSMTFSIVATEAPRVLKYVAQFLTAGELANSTNEFSLWGENADPDADGLSNSMETCLGTHPLETSAPISAQLYQGSFAILLPEPTGTNQSTFALQSSEDLLTWRTLVREVDYTQSSVETEFGRRVALRTTLLEQRPRSFYRVGCITN